MRKHSTFNIQHSTLNALAMLTAAIILSAAIDHTASAQTNSDFSSFGKFIAERNIFNPNRYARSANNYRPRTTRTVRRPSFSLAGIMSYGEGETPGTYAFFDGTSSEYRKTLQPEGTIANFKVTAITHDTVTLLRDTNEIVLKIGMGLREESTGHWTLSEGTTTFARNSSTDESSRGSWSSRRNSGSRSFGGSTSQTVSESTDTTAQDSASQDMPGGPPGGGPPDEMGAPPDESGGPPDSSATETTAPPTGPGSDVLQRLMQQRQQEETGGNNSPRN